MISKTTSIIIQIIIWLALFSFLLFMGAEYNNWFTACYRGVLIIGLLVTLTYTNAFIFVPRFFNSKWISLYFLIVIGLILLSVKVSMIFIFTDSKHLEITLFNKLNGMKNVTDGTILFQPLIMILTISSFFISSIIVIIKEIAAQKRKELENEIELKTSELKLISTQFSPHFLLNSLNNLYSISKLKPHKVSEHIEHLSALMTHITYEQKEKKISLGKEINFIENYIFFQQEKGENLYFVNQDFDQVDKSLQIEPRLLIPFVENAFKYAYHPNKTMKVDLSMNNNKEGFYFKISNEISDFKRRKKEDGYFGIGIDSVKFLLENLYPNKHQLEVLNDGKEYTISLKIQLTK